MMVRRAVVGLGATALVALVALAPQPAAAGPVVLNATMVCANITIGGGAIDIAQTGGTGTGKLELTGPANANLSLTVKMSNLPPSTPAACAAVCVVNGFTDLLRVATFEPCGTTTAGGKLTFTGTVAPFDGPPFEGGCVLPIPAVWISPETDALVPVEELVLCTAGFGEFEPVCLGPGCV